MSEVGRENEQIICRQRRKVIKTEIIECEKCVKFFHPSCHKLHKVANSVNELVPCKGRVRHLVKGNVKECSER